MNLPIPYPIKINELKTYLEQKGIDNIPSSGYTPITYSLIDGNEAEIDQKLANLDNETETLLQKYSLARANNQINEACNKLWAVVEFLHLFKLEQLKEKSEFIGPKFWNLFVNGTLIPALYYAQITAMISALSLFGYISMRKEDKDYFLVRTKNKWQFVKRADRWHKTVSETYFGLLSKEVELPGVDKNLFDGLQYLRNETHYRVLSDTKVTKTMGDHSFNFIPLVSKTILETISKLKTASFIKNNCDTRFNELVCNLPKLYQEYSKDVPEELTQMIEQIKSDSS